MTFGCINCAKKVLLSVLWYFTPYSHALCNMQQLGNGMHTCCAGVHSVLTCSIQIHRAEHMSTETVYIQSLHKRFLKRNLANVGMRGSMHECTG